MYNLHRLADIEILAKNEEIGKEHSHMPVAAVALPNNCDLFRSQLRLWLIRVLMCKVRQPGERGRITYNLQPDSQIIIRRYCGYALVLIRSLQLDYVYFV